MHKGLKKAKFICLTAVLSCTFAALSGCSAAPAQINEDNIVITMHPEEEPVYITTAASYGDVVKTVRVICSYKHTDEYEITSSMIGKKIEEIYVEEGDNVTAGQLIAKLSGGDIQGSIDELEYKIARNRLLLEHLAAEENEALSYRWWTFVYQSSQSQADTENLEQSLESIRRNYRYRREDYEDTIRLDSQQLEIYRQEIDQYLIRTNMDGEVSHVYDHLIGQVLTKETTLARIFDKSQCIFESTQTEYAHFFHEGEPAKLSVNVAGNTLVLDVVPLNMDNWDEKLTFSIPPLENESIPSGALGRIVITADSRSNVLTVPNDAVHTVSTGEKYVYTLGENNIHELRWVETGLKGDKLTEIISGLTEGEHVLLK